MDAKELKEVGHQIAVSILTNKSIEETVYGLGRVLSYLESEQEKRMRLETALKNNSEQMQELQKQLWGSVDKPGIIHQINSIKENSDRNSKLLRGIFSSMAGLVLLEILRLAFQNLKL